MPVKLDAEVKQFEDEYKKCRVMSKGGVKDVEKYTKRIKYYRYDMLMGLEGLEEEVAAHKCGTDPIDAKKIDDYAQDKKFRNVLKGINWNYAKLEKACEKLERQEKDAVIAANEKKLKNLKVKIAKDLTKRKKEKTPSKTAIEKLEKQVNDDLGLLDELRVLFEKNPVSLIGVKKRI